MRITVRLIFLLLVAIIGVACISAEIQVRSLVRGLRSDLVRRAEVLADSLQVTIEPLIAKGDMQELQHIVDRFGNRERLFGVVVYDQDGKALAMTSGLEARRAATSTLVNAGFIPSSGQSDFMFLGSDYTHVYSLPLRHEGVTEGELVLLHNADYILAQRFKVWRDAFWRMMTQSILVVIITLLMIRWSLKGPIARTANRLRILRTRGQEVPVSVPEDDLFRPLLREASHLAHSLSAARAAAEVEARLRVSSETTWTSERLRVHVQKKLENRPVFVVSNREPYMHVHRGKSVEVMVPASGLVTALEPVLRACNGTWIAHGSGDADVEMVDQNGRLQVPPDDPQYTLRRVWLGKEEEGYYYGFANEGLWPLCHLAHTRPMFRTSDWEDYQTANRKFARVCCEELKDVEEPIVLIQDYHFALLPRLVKQERPDARVAIFWHIPWPNPEAFGICPWQRELLDGLLGADLVAFHIQAHCTNFLETVDHALESRIEWERFAVSRSGHRTFVKPFPISVDMADEPAEQSADIIIQDRHALGREMGLETRYIGIGVDRIDYTKGILERFHAIERFLDKYPSYQGQFTFVQIGAPSRTHIRRYHEFQAEVEAEADRINWRLQTGVWKPILYLNQHHGHDEIGMYYRVADLCLVTSLHDGMNLVAKEFVGARTDEQGVLILSLFTGASRELNDALIVNPYDTEQVADAICYALEMDPSEQRRRMQRMRHVVREQNVFRWAGNLIGELAEIQIESAQVQMVERRD